MAACGSLQHIFDNNNLLPENQSLLLETLSWNQIKPLNSLYQPSSSLTEVFGELHSTENEDSVPSSTITEHTSRHKSSDSFSSLSLESLQLCTEGLGFESSDEVEDLKSGCFLQSEKKHEGSSEEGDYYNCRRSRVMNEGGTGYPPPISCTGRFKSFRSNGRFILREIRIPRQEFLHAYREDGRLKLQFIQPEFLEEEYDDDDDDEEEEEEAEDHVNEVKWMNA